MKAVTKLVMAVLLVSGFAMISQATTVEMAFTGRLVESNCNSKTGLGDVTFAVYSQKLEIMYLYKLNVVNESLCTSNPQIFGQRLTDLAFQSLLGADADGSERPRLHKFKINFNGIVTDISEVLVDNAKLAKIYRKFNLLDINSYTVREYRHLPSEGSHRHAEHAAYIVNSLR